MNPAVLSSFRRFGPFLARSLATSGGPLRLAKSVPGPTCEDTLPSDGGPLVAHVATVEVPVCSVWRARNLKDRTTSAIPKTIA